MAPTTLRNDFPFLASFDGVYADSTSQTLLPSTVLDKTNAYYQGGFLPRGQWKELVEDVRSALQSFLGARYAREIAFTEGLGHSINLVAQGFPWETCVEPTVLVDLPNPVTTVFPWLYFGEELGFEVVLLERDPSKPFPQDQFLGQLEDNDVDVVVLPYVDRLSGQVLPIAELVQLSHERGAQVCVDGTNAFGRRPINVVDQDIDFLVGSFANACGPTGIGFLYSPLISGFVPPLLGDLSIRDVTYKGGEFGYNLSTGTDRLEGAFSNFGSLPAVLSCVDYLQSKGLDRLAHTEVQLAEELVRELKNVLPTNTRLFCPEEVGSLAPTLSVDLGDLLDPQDVAMMLETEHSIICRAGELHMPHLMDYLSLDKGVLEISLAFYNTVEDVSRIGKALGEVCGLFI